MNDHKNRQQFRCEEFVPVVGARNPKLAVTDKRFSLNETRDQKSPGKNQQGGKGVQHTGHEADRNDLTCPFSRLVPHEHGDQHQRYENFRPVPAHVLAEDVKDLMHARFCLTMLSGCPWQELGKSRAKTSATTSHSSPPRTARKSPLEWFPG